MEFPKVSFIIPVRNEEHTIRQCLDSLLIIDYPQEKIEIILAEGKSKDNTRKIIDEYTKKYSSIQVFDDIYGNKSKARNICVQKSTGEFLMNYSGHAIAEKNLLKVLVSKFMSNEIAGVGCPNLTPNQDDIGKLIGKLLTGFMAGGKSNVFTQNTTLDKEKFVNHIPFVCYRKTIFDDVGYFDENFQYGQDSEFNIRIIKAGYKILYTPETKVYLYKPTSLKKLFKKMCLYGEARSKIIKKHPDQSNLSYTLPPIIFIICPFALILLSVITVYYDPLYLLLFASICYGILCLISSISISKKIKDILLGLIVYPIIHFGYSIGLLKGMSS